MKMTKIRVVQCLLALMPSAASAQIARISIPISPLGVVSGALVAAPRLQEPASAMSVPLALPILHAPNAAPSPAPAAKMALPDLKAGAARFTEAERPDASAAASRVSASMFDGAAEKSDGLESPTADPRVAALNAAVTEILKPFNNELTKASFVFNRLEMNAQRATQADISVSFDKQGRDGTAALKIDRLSYSYPEEPGALPRTEGRIKLDYNLRNVWTQKQINQFGISADQMVADFLDEYTAKYDKAVTLDARVANKQTDAQGNLTGLDLILAVKFDFSKLPEGVDLKTIEITEGRVEIKITLDAMEAAFSVVSNPDSTSFHKEETGLKEIVEKLLARDPKTMRKISQMAKQLDSLSQFLTTRRTR